MICGLLALAAGCVLGWLGRYFVIEGDQIHLLCAATPPPVWCDGRVVLIALSFRGTWGIAAVAAAAIAWATRRHVAATFAVMALLAGGLGLQLYDATWAASGVLAALLRLPRTGAQESPDPREFSA